MKITTRKWNVQRWRIAKRAAIHAQVSWRVSWCCSTALSHFPPQNYFKTKKISKQKISYFITNGRSFQNGRFKHRHWLTSFIMWFDCRQSLSVSKSFLDGKDFYKPKFNRILLPKTMIARLQGPCGLANFFVIGPWLLAIQRDFWYTHPPPTRGKIVFTPPRNI